MSLIDETTNTPILLSTLSLASIKNSVSFDNGNTIIIEKKASRDAIYEACIWIGD
jgi:hypothetical protein